MSCYAYRMKKLVLLAALLLTACDGGPSRPPQVPDHSHAASGSTYVKIFDDGQCVVYRDNPLDNTRRIHIGICHSGSISITLP